MRWGDRMHDIPTISYLDLRASYTWNKVTVRAGVNNVLDKDPPLIDTINSGGNSIFAESNTYLVALRCGGKIPVPQPDGRLLKSEQ